MGNTALGEVIVDAIYTCVKPIPKAILFVRSHHGRCRSGVFVKSDIPGFVRKHAIPIADIMRVPINLSSALLTSPKLKPWYRCTFMPQQTKRGAWGPKCNSCYQCPSVAKLRKIAFERCWLLLARAAGLFYQPRAAVDAIPPNGAGDATSFAALPQSESLKALVKAAASVAASYSKRLTVNAGGTGTLP